jgi:hypothetical protein
MTQSPALLCSVEWQLCNEVFPAICDNGAVNFRPSPCLTSDVLSLRAVLSSPRCPYAKHRSAALVSFSRPFLPVYFQAGQRSLCTRQLSVLSLPHPNHRDAGLRLWSNGSSFSSAARQLPSASVDMKAAEMYPLEIGESFLVSPGTEKIPSTW